MAPTDESTETLFNTRRRRRFITSSSVGWWQKIRTAKIERSSGSLWTKSVSALVKIRDVAGQRLKTLIRRFNRNRSNNNNNNHVNIQYDAMSYAKNFDDGHGQNPQSNEEDGYYYASRNFESRYGKTSTDMDKDGPNFV